MVNLQQLMTVDQTDLESILQEYHVPGMAIGIYTRSSKYYRVVGNRDGQRAVDEHTSFRVASLTKPVFSYLVLQYVVDGILDLDQPLINYYGKRYMDDELIEKLTLRHILSHQSGWPNWARTEPLQFNHEPEPKFGYSGEGMVYLQHILHQLTNQLVFRLMEDKIYSPLGMSHSGFDLQFVRTANRTQPHDSQGQFIDQRRHATTEILDYINRMPRYGNAAGTMWASIADYTTFLHHLMFSSDKVTSSIRELMIQPQCSTGTEGLSWGLGIGIEEFDDQSVLWQWGSDRGFKSYTINFLNDEVGLVIFTNGENGYEVYKAVFEEILDELPYFVKHKSL